MAKSRKRSSRNIHFLDEIGTIKNKSVLLHLISRKCNIPSGQLPLDTINSNALLTENQLYYDDALNITEPHDPDATTLLIRIIGNPPSADDELYVCLSRNADNAWEGGRVGSVDFLLEGIPKRSDNIQENTQAAQDIEPSATEQHADDREEAKEQESNTEADKIDEQKTLDEENEKTVLSDEEKAIENDSMFFDEMNQKFATHEASEETEEDDDESSAQELDTSLYDSVPDTPEELERLFPPVEDESIIKAHNAMLHTSNASDITILANVEKVVNNQVIVMSQSWTTKAGDYNALRYYLESICCYAYTHQDKQDIITNSMDDYVINTGILDIFGQEVLICFHVVDDRVNITIDDFSSAESKSVLLKKGFTETDIRKTLRPVTVWDNDDISRIKTAKYEDFDISDRSKLKLLMTEKSGLFQSCGIDATPYTLARSIEESIQLALRINERDENYIRPGYDMVTGHVHFLLPLRIQANIDSMADLILEIAYDDGLYRIHDILTHEEAYLKSKVISPYCASL